MRLSGWHHKAALLLLLGFLGCTVPSAANTPPLTATAAKSTIDSFNPTYCKVVEFYGFHKATEGAATTQTAYVLLVNPSEKAQKQVVFTARFQLLTLPDGRQQWFLTSLVSHGAGLSRRQGWDNLVIPVKDATPAAAGGKQ
ncbi:MAG: hypothetical protein Q8M54_01050 [Desulfobaccales bacterium]|nr:hypothetical protein [Desulfobaccales bacterium]